MNKKIKIIGILAIVIIVAISASVVNSFCSTKEIVNNPGLRVSTSYEISDFQNYTQLKDPKTNRFINIENSGTFIGDYNFFKDDIPAFNAKKDAIQDWNQSTKDSFKASISPITISNGMETYKYNSGGLFGVDEDIYNINGKSGYPVYFSYPTVSNNIFFKQLVIN